MLSFSLFAIGMVLLSILFSNLWMQRNAATRLYSDIERLPERPLALVLGTRKLMRNGYPNPYFDYRMDAAAALYQHGKVRHLLLSGANPRADYNEPDDMRAALLKRGVPAAALSLDYAGLRTLDSVVRARQVFSQDDFIIVSQRFHNERALFICDYYGIQALGFNAQDVPVARSLRVTLRENLARVKALLDLYVLKTQPRFLGKKVDLPL